ncbi:MAG TPA: endolytic transglycosylase MltG [Terriglobales bacterium]|nr:endolytic transglycosylase MltG [Terriglobales bacterium]
MKTLFKLFVLLVLVAAGWVGYGLLLPTRPQNEMFVLLRPGWTTRRIATELKNAGVIRDSNAFLLWHYITRPRSLKAGEYRFDHAASALQVHERIAAGDIFKHTVVIPEGYNMFDIAAAIEAAGLGTRDEFLKVARASTALVSDIDPEAESLEGYLFPDTYQFTRTQTMADIAAMMVKRFRQEARAIGLLKASNSPEPNRTNVRRIVTMASIVEKETAAPEERPTVAGVYYNRLARKMSLDADPSVIYAALLAGKYRGAIFRSDLNANSPYNTYRNPGLPPGPIGNPGRASLEAAMRPAQTDFLFFVSDADGHHRFARTLDEHSRNVAAYRRAVSGR